MERQYTVYQLAIKGHGVYVGMTQQALRERVRQHFARAKQGEDKRPLMQILREVECSAVEVSILHQCQDKAEAQAAIGAKISESLRQHHRNQTPEQRAKQLAQLAEARKKINHEVRAQRQREAVQKYWEEKRRAEGL